MWFISYNDDKSKTTYVKKIFNNKTDAHKYAICDLKDTNTYNISIHNGDTELVSQDISNGVCLKRLVENRLVDYGTICDISGYLIMIEKPNGDISEFTKARVNKEFIKGNFCI